jgi:hypothetical protein
MKKLSVPYFNCKRSDITQVFGVVQSFGGKHTGVDFAFSGCYGKFLVAPTRVLIKRIVTDSVFDNDYYPAFQKGYGILMQDADDPTVDYLYWHIMQIIPVSIGEVIQQGEIVAQIGNSGYCTSGGELIPLSKRPGGFGSHLHFEKRIDNVCVDVLPDIDFNLQPSLDSNKKALEIINRIISFITKK